MSVARHYFTVEEANNTLEVIRPLMDEILGLRRSILAKRPEVWPVVEKALGNGGNFAASNMVFDFIRLGELARQIQATGALLKDANVGLVDFPALRDGREVYLCWRYNEPDVAFWHNLNAGFSGRQPI